MDNRLIGEYQADGNVKQDIIRLGTLPVATVDTNGEIHYIHTDHLGTPRAATAPGGEVVWNGDTGSGLAFCLSNNPAYARTMRPKEIVDLLYSYNTAGQIIPATDARRQTTAYNRDPLGRITQSTYGDGSSASYRWNQGDNHADT